MWHASFKTPYLVVEIGTFCDFRMMDTLVTPLRAEHTLVFITSHTRQVASEDVKVSYDVPESVLTDPDAAAAMVGMGFGHKLWHILRNIFTTGVRFYIDYLIMSNALSRLIERTYQQYRPVGVLAHCGTTMQILASRVFASCPTTIVYFAPGFLPNYEVPFAFDVRVKDPDFDLYDPRRRNDNATSGLAYQDEVKHQASILTDSYSHLNCVRHVNAFGAPLVPDLTYTPQVPALCVTNIGMLRPREHVRAPKRMNVTLKRWIASNTAPLILVTFGSFDHKLPQEFVERLLRAAVDYASRNTLRVVVITPRRAVTIPSDPSMCHICRDYVPYRAIVPYCQLVCFTGSVCLQNECWYRSRNMLFVPVITEQYFWAKLYRHHTGVSFIDYRAEYTEDGVRILIHHAHTYMNARLFRSVRESFCK